MANGNVIKKFFIYRVYSRLIICVATYTFKIFVLVKKKYYNIMIWKIIIFSINFSIFSLNALSR